MPSIGETLRDARMRQRLDIADVESRTKIRAKYLRALENEEFGMLPGPTFVKTFLRTYAEALGLDPQVLVEEYRSTYESRDEVEHLQQLGPTAVGPRPPPRAPPGGGGAAAAAQGEPARGPQQRALRVRGQRPGDGDRLRGNHHRAADLPWLARAGEPRQDRRPAHQER